MRTLDEAKNYFAFHPATAEAAARYDRIRRGYLHLVDVLWAELPDGPDKTTALRQLHLASMLSIGAVAVNDTPADYANPQVARVLPPRETGHSKEWAAGPILQGPSADARPHHP